MLLKQSTAYTRMFLMVDASDHVSAKTGLTCTVNLSKAGAAFGAAGGTITEVANGFYKIALTTTDTNTLGDLAFHITGSGADPSDFVDQIGVRNTDDLAFPATSGRSMVVDAAGLVDANTVKLGPTGAGTAQTARDVGTSVLISSGSGTGQLDVTSGVIKANLAQILGTALTETAGQLAAAFKKFFNIGSPASTMDALTLCATVTTVTTTTTATNLTNAPTAGDFTATMKTSLNAATPAVTVSDKTGFSLSTAGTQAIWDKLTSALTTSGSIGKLLVDNITASISGVAAAVWDVTLSSHLTSGTTGNALNAAGSAGDPWATALPGAYGAGTAGKIIGSNLDAAVSTRSTYAGGDTSGTTTLLSRLGSALSITGGKVDVNDKTGFSLSSAGVQAIWDALTSALTTAGSIGKLLSQLTFSVTNVLDSNVVDWKGTTAPAMTGDAYGALTGAQAEPGQGAPAVNAAPLTKLAFLFKAWRNKVAQTSSQYSLYADDGTTVDQKAPIADDGTTFTRSELVTGP